MNKDRKKDKKVRLKKDHFKRAGVCEVSDLNGNRLYLITKDNRVIHRGYDVTRYLESNTFRELEELEKRLGEKNE